MGYFGALLIGLAIAAIIAFDVFLAPGMVRSAITVAVSGPAQLGAPATVYAAILILLVNATLLLVAILGAILLGTHDVRQAIKRATTKP